MERRFTVWILGVQHFPDGRADQIEQKTEGNFAAREDGSFRLLYNGAGGRSDKEARNLIGVDGEKVFTYPWGKPEYRQEYERGKTFSGLYSTPYGELSMEIVTINLDYCLTANGGRIRLEYDLFLDHSKVSRNDVEIKIEEAQ